VTSDEWRVKPKAPEARYVFYRCAFLSISRSSGEKWLYRPWSISRSRADGGISCNARMAFSTSRRGAAVAGSIAGERNAAALAAALAPALAMITPFALGGRLGFGDVAPESRGEAIGGRLFQSLGLGAALGGGTFIRRLSR
jgi:hypothetical protein